jgi:hypothetical protein
MLGHSNPSGIKKGYDPLTLWHISFSTIFHTSRHWLEETTHRKRSREIRSWMTTDGPTPQSVDRITRYKEGDRSSGGRAKMLAWTETECGTAGMLEPNHYQEMSGGLFETLNRARWHLFDFQQNQIGSIDLDTLKKPSEARDVLQGMSTISPFQSQPLNMCPSRFAPQKANSDTPYTGGRTRDSACSRSLRSRAGKAAC